LAGDHINTQYIDKAWLDDPMATDINPGFFIPGIIVDPIKL
jgi:hypothetical protein